MTPVTPYLSRAALALMAGAAAATAVVAVAPGSYYDVIEWHVVEPEGMALLSHAVTVGGVVSDLLMAAVVFLVGKEGWEALTHERSGLSGRRAVLPALAAFGGMAGAALVWLALSGPFETAEEAAGAPGWLVPMGGDVALVYLFARRIFGRGHPALQLLLFVVVAQLLTALVLTGLVVRAPEAGRPVFALLSFGAAMAGWVTLTRPLSRPGATEVQRHRATALGPWIVLAGISWTGFALAGLPPALGFLPVLPAMPQASRSFGLFAVAEGFLTDPANRLAHRLLPAMVVILFLFGCVAGGIDTAAVAPTTWILLAALWIGKPLGFLAAAWIGQRLAPGALPRGVHGRDLWLIAGLTGISFVGPALVMAQALPGGGMQEAARIGLALTVLAGPALALATAPPRRRGALPPPT